jgi:hypothetical protein
MQTNIGRTFVSTPEGWAHYNNASDFPLAELLRNRTSVFEINLPGTEKRERPTSWSHPDAWTNASAPITKDLINHFSSVLEISHPGKKATALRALRVLLATPESSFEVVKRGIATVCSVGATNGTLTVEGTLKTMRLWVGDQAVLTGTGNLAALGNQPFYINGEVEVSRLGDGMPLQSLNFRDGTQTYTGQSLTIKGSCVFQANSTLIIPTFAQGETLGSLPFLSTEAIHLSPGMTITLDANVNRIFTKGDKWVVASSKNFQTDEPVNTSLSTLASRIRFTVDGQEASLPQGLKVNLIPIPLEDGMKQWHLIVEIVEDVPPVAQRDEAAL